MALTVETMLQAARARLVRVDPHDADVVGKSGGLLIDIRPADERRREGDIPGAIPIERNVLEWRLDPASGHRIPEVTGHGQAIVLVCTEGYASSLAAAALQDLGLTRAADLVGGFRAWAAADLPVLRRRE